MKLKGEASMDQLLRKMNFKFFGESRHKVTPDKLIKMENVVLLDVRSREEADTISMTFRHHPNITCLHIPLDELPDRFGEIPREQDVAIFCPANVRASIAYMYLLTKEFPDVRILDGGYAALVELVKPGAVWKVVQNKE
jgi:rhodanese-related sulfurtransferase